MLERLSPARRNIALLILAAAVLWFCWTVRSVLNPLILAYLLAYVLHPLVERLESRGWSRKTAVNVIFVSAGFLLIVTGAGLTLQAKSLALEFRSDEAIFDHMQERIDQGLANLQHKLEDWNLIDKAPPAPVGADGEVEPAPPIWSLRSLLDEARKWLQERGGADAGKAGLQAAGGVLQVLQQLFGSVFSLMTLLVLLPIYTYFLLFQLDGIHSFVRRYLPKREKQRILRITSQIGEVLSSFFRGRLLVCLLKGLFLALGLWVAGAPYALLLGFLSGALSLIPFVGPVVGFLLALGLALLQFDLGPALVRTGIVYGLGEVLEGYVLVPKILGGSLGLPLVVVLVSLMVGGEAMGLFGLLVALPLTATVIILMRELVLPALKAVAEGPPPERKT